jgi:hypothetical protein
MPAIAVNDSKPQWSRIHDRCGRGRSGRVLQDDQLSRLLTFPNVLITAHQAFLTREALGEIARVTVENVVRQSRGEPFLPGTLLKWPVASTGFSGLLRRCWLCGFFSRASLPWPVPRRSLLLSVLTSFLTGGFRDRACTAAAQTSRSIPVDVPHETPPLKKSQSPADRGAPRTAATVL